MLSSVAMFERQFPSWNFLNLSSWRHGIAEFPCQKWRDVQPLSACASVYNNKLSDVLPPNILHRVKLKLIKFSKTNYSNYVLRTQRTIHTRDVYPCSTVHTLHCTCMPHVKKIRRRMAPCGVHTDNSWNRNKPYRYASHNAVCFRFGELHANNSREWAHKNSVLRTDCVQQKVGNFNSVDEWKLDASTDL